MMASAAVIVASIAGYLYWTRTPQSLGRTNHKWPARELIKPIYPGEIVEARMSELLPSDAADYAANYRLCEHWSGEDAYSEERGEEIARGMETCNGLEATRDSLLSKYPRGSSVDSTLRWMIAEIDSGSDAYVWDDPHHRSNVLNRYYESWGQGTSQRVDELIAQRRALSDTTSAATRSMVLFMIKVEAGYLNGLVANIDRLHPLTAEEVRSACVRWERMTGEKVGQR